VSSRTASSCARIVIACALIGLAGCWPTDLLTDNSEQVLGYTPEDPSANTTDVAANVPDSSDWPTHIETETNDAWEQAESVTFTGNIRLGGSIAANVKDCDIYNLGGFEAGQRVQVDLTNNGSDVRVGLFDSQGRILAHLDPLSSTAGPSRINFVLRETTTSLYVMVSTRTTSTDDRVYWADVQVSEPEQLPASEGQNVILVFGGASQVKIGSRTPVDVPAFDIGSINANFSGQTEYAINLLMQIVREDYAGLNVTFYRDNQSNLPTENVTAIYFGTSDSRLLGLADNVDPYNSDPSQSAILYTDSFALFNQLSPTFEATVQVLANVTSHETGHLLGLRHTADPEDLMDVTATARQMLADQYFKTTSLHSSVMPYGLQDAPTMLAWSIGGEFIPPASGKILLSQRTARSLAPAVPDFYIPRSHLMDCGCHHCDITGQ
jgi:hypothetical protein